MTFAQIATTSSAASAAVALQPAVEALQPIADRQSGVTRPFEKSVSLLSWAYNEEDSIANFLERAIQLLEANVADWEIVLINDGSTDKTAEIMETWAKREPRIRVIHNEQNLNVGRSCRKAIQSASKEYLFWQTIDWAYDISNFRLFLELSRHYDVVQGVRPTPIRLLSYIPLIRSIYRVKTRSDNFKKAIVSLSNYYLVRILFGVSFHDFQNVTFYPTKLIQSVELVGNSSFLNPECLIRTLETGATYIEVPIPFIPRTVGEAKGTRISAILRSVKDLLSGWIRWGVSGRLSKKFDSSRISRVSEPFKLEPEVASLVVPLFRYYR